MKVAVIGGESHVGSNLVTALINENVDVVVIHTTPDSTFEKPKQGVARILQANYQRRSKDWYAFVENLEADVCVDLICTDLPGTYHALKEKTRHFLAVGDFRMYGRPQIVPTPEEKQGPCEFDDLALQFREIVGVQHQAHHDDVSFTALVTPPITGPGAIPFDCLGGRDVEVHRSVSKSGKVSLPTGCHALIAPVDVEDVARSIMFTLRKQEIASGEIYNIGPPYAISMEKLVQEYAVAYQTDISVEYVPWQNYFNEINPDPEKNYFFRTHIVPDTTKIRSQLEYEAHFTPEGAVARGIEWMMKQYGID